MIELRPFHHEPKIVWLDTNVVINIAEAFCRTTKNDNDNNYLSLYSKLKYSVDKNKIICPFLDQRDEYINTDKYEICDQILLCLGKGKQLKTYLTENSQIKRMLESYINKSGKFYFLKSDISFYYESEKDEHNEKSDLGFSIVILQSGQNKEGQDNENSALINYLQRRKRHIFENKLIRRQVLNEEMFVRREIVAKSVEEIKKCYGYIYTDFGFLSYEYCKIYPLIAYKEITMKKQLDQKDVDFVLNFLGAKDYIIPYDEIYSNLVTKILIGNERIKKGDVRDMQNMSLILPYASIIITEKAMRGHVEQLKLDKKYDTEIYSLNQIDQILGKIEDI